MILSNIDKLKEEYKEEILKLRSLKLPIIIFGAGGGREFNLYYLRKLGINPVAICDNDSNKWNIVVDDIRVQSFDQIKEKYEDAYFYISANCFYFDIFKQITEAGYKEENISRHDIILQFLGEENAYSYYKTKENELDYLYKQLADDKSREVLLNRMAFYRTRNRKYMMDVRTENQYFDASVYDVRNIRCYIDSGMYTGDSIESFISNVGNDFDKIYGFEPDEKFCHIAKKAYNNCENIVCVQSANSDVDGVINVSDAGKIMKSIERDTFKMESETGDTFRVCKLDSYFYDKEDKIDMIKMDIEGAELAALKGAKEVIQKFKPLLAICVYHKITDLLEIPKYCMGLGVPYDIYLRHYSDSSLETVCYFIPTA